MAESVSNENEGCVLQQATRLSDSILWDLQRKFYDSRGADAWEQGTVPSFITSNCFIARSYAKTALSYVRDFCQAHGNTIDRSQPVYIIEIGCGHGKFGFLFMRQYQEIRREFRAIDVDFRYVMTDFTENNLRYWMAHPSLQPFVDSGLLDFAQFDAENGTEMHLLNSGAVLAPGLVKNPMIMFANYLFDTLKHDAFRTIKGTLYEGLVEVGSKNSHEPDPTDPTILERLNTHWVFRETTSNYYDNPMFNQVLEWYRNNTKESTFLIPIGAFKCISSLLEISNNRLFVLSGDKGNSHLSAWDGLDDPHVAVHGSFSMMVNYHAIAVLCSDVHPLRAHSMHTLQQEGSLKISAFMFTPNPDAVLSEFELTILAFRQYIDEFGPSDFFFLQQSVKGASPDDSPRPSVRHVLSVMKLSCFDPEVFFKFCDAIIDQIEDSSELVCSDTVRVIEETWKNFYRLDNAKDVPFEMGRLYFGMQHYTRALFFYIVSHQLFGENHVTYYNIGISLYELGDLIGAEKYLGLSLSLDPTYERSVTWLNNVKEEVKMRTTHSLPLFFGKEENRAYIEEQVRRICPDYHL